MASQNKFVISKLLDDLTHLEINTIIKKGMTSAPQPEEIEEVLYVLLTNYKEKTEVIIKRNELDFKTDEDKIHSYEEFYKVLDDMNKFMDSEGIRIDEGDYILFMRMKSFCNYLYSRRNSIKFKPEPKVKEGETIYTINLKNFCDFKLEMDTRDRVMIKRLYDLGTERIVMQTRFGIDGDVVTRIEENFANRPKQIVLDLHEEHTNLSIKYWQSLVSVAKSLVTDLFGKK